MANNTKIDLDKQVLSLGEGFEALWENINEKFARKSDNTIPTRTVFAYKTSTSQPGKPMGGSWNNKTNEVVYPRNNPDDLDQEHTWGGADNIERPIWMSVKTFATEPAAETDWSQPTMISGENGAPGADGLSREFVYKLTKTEFEVPGGEDPNYAENLPSEQVNGFVPDGWRDRPTGISEEYRAEWQLTRTKQEDGTWGKWSGPSLWSKYGVNGQDGDSVEYIYMRTKTTEELDGIKVTTPPVIPGYDVDSDEFQGVGAYYGKEYVPDGWSDNPVDVDDEWMWCWVSQRKKKDNKWQRFSDPTLWAKYGETGKSGFTVKNLYWVTAYDYEDVNNMIARNENNPGSQWSKVMEKGDNDTNIWGITAIWDTINNKLADGEEWQGPFLISSSLTSSRPNFQVNVFAEACEDSDGNTVAPPAPENGINYDDEFEDGKYTAVGGTGTDIWEAIWYTNIQGKGVEDTTDKKVWYICTGKVNGITRTVEWGPVERYTAMDGDAQPGKYIEYRYAASTHPDIMPSIEGVHDRDGNPVWDPSAEDIQPVRWVLTNPIADGYEIEMELSTYSSAIEASKSMVAGKLIQVTQSETITPEGGNSETYYPGLYLVVEPGKVTKFKQYIWQIWATKTPNRDGIGGQIEIVDGLGWQGPVRISGEPGESIMGDVGPSGVPGANFTPLYMRGNSEGPEFEWNESFKHLDEGTLISSGWDQAPPQVDAQFPYVWCTQAKMIWEYDENNVMVQKVGPDGWCTPFRMSGLNVMDQPGAITLYAVLDNPADTVICDTEGNVPQSNLGIKTTFKVYKGTSEKHVKSLVIDDEVSGIEYTIEGATLTVNRITSTEDKIYIPLRATVDDLGQELSYRTVFSISKLYAGAPTIVTDFGNENITVPATTDGVLEEGVYPIETSLHVYLGTSEINVFNVQSSDCTYTINNGVLSITKIPNFTNDTALLNFDVVFEKEGKEYTKSAQLRVVKVKQGRDSVIYELSTNTNAIRRTQDNQIVPTTLDVVVLRKTGDGEVTTLNMNQIQSFGKVVYSVDNENFVDFPMSGSLELNNQSLDLEQYIELKLIDIQDQNKYLDKDTLYLLHDGLPAVQYSLVVNRDVVQYDENGRVNDTTSIVCDLVKVNGSSYEKVYGVPVGYDLEYSIDGGRSKPYSPSTSIAFNEFERILEFRFYTSINGERVLIDYDKVVVMKPAQGERGRIIYPAGIYDPNKTYITDKEKAPYVLDTNDKKFYVLAKETSWNGAINDGKLPSDNAVEDNPVWEAFEMFEAVYAQIGVFNQALVGSAVFYEEFVFSQSGRNSKGDASTNYQLFNPDDPYGQPNGEGFYPSICFNFVSGAFWLGGNKINYDPIKNTINLKGVTMKWQDIEDLPEDFEKLATTAGQSATQAEAYANIAQQQAAATNDRVNNWADDGMISPTEQSALRDKKSEMTAEYNKIINDINAFNNSVTLGDTYKVSTSSIEYAYNRACAAIDYHSNPINEPAGNENVAIKDTEADGDIRFSNIAAYYAALVEITDIYAKKSADYAEALANKYTDGEIGKSDQRTADAIDKALDEAAAEAQKIVNNNKQSIIDASVQISQQNINTAKQTLTDELNTKAAALQKAINDGDTAAIAQANAALEKANDAKEAVGVLEGAIEDLEGSVFSEGDITNLSIAAIQTATEITGDTVASQTVIGRNIIGLAGTFAKIQAENIEGTTISGKTIQSANKISGTNDPTWQIKNAGDGYLAQKNISWNTAGDLTVKGKINGSVGSTMGPWQTFDSGSVKYIADADTYASAQNAFGSDGSFKLGGSQGIVKSGNNITFGNDVVLEWSGGESSGVTSEQFSDLMDSWLNDSKNDGKINGTKITSNSITTGLIQANAITGDLVKADTIQASKLVIDEVFIGKVATALIQADVIKTNRLDTNIDPEGEGKNKGRIIIEGNTITALNNAMDEEVLFVTGGKLDDIPQVLSPSATGTDIYFSENEFGDAIYKESGHLTSYGIVQTLSTSGMKEGYKYTITIPTEFGISLSCKLMGSETLQPRAVLTYAISDHEYDIETESDRIPWYNSLMEFEDVLVAGSSSINRTDSYPMYGYIDTSNGVPDSIFLYYKMELFWDGMTGEGPINASGFVTTKSGVQVKPTINRTDVSNTGFRAIMSATEYMQLSKNKFEVRMGDFMFRVMYDGTASSGIRVSKDGGSNWTSLIQ